MRDTRYQWAYLFGAACPERGVGAGLVLPRANTEAMNLHLAEIAATVAPGAHAVLVLDGAGWHRGGDLVVPPNLTLVKLPPYAPELNSAENIWEYLRKNKLATASTRTTALSSMPVAKLGTLRRKPNPCHLRNKASLGTRVMIYGGRYNNIRAAIRPLSSAIELTVVSGGASSSPPPGCR